MMGRLILINEEQVDMIKKSTASNKNEGVSVFMSEIKNFLYNIMKGESKSTTDYWKLNGIKRGDLYRKLKSYSIITEVEDGKIKVPKKNFETKVNRLYYEIFPEDDDNMIISEDDGGGESMGGATSAMSSGSYEAPLFGKPIKRAVK